MQTEFDFIKVPYTTSPVMYKNTGDVFIRHPNLSIIEQKKQELLKYSTDLYAQLDGMNKIIEKAAGICNVYTDTVQDLALMLEEDVAVMYEGKLAAICFCFPSGFIPSSRVGMTLSDIHRPVGDGENLVRASPGIARVMTEQPSFRRYVWTVTKNPDLSNHPNNIKNKLVESIDDLYFRYETQTTARVDDKTSLFFVKVDVVPLKTVYSDKIKNSINSMSEEVLKYKNLTEIKNLLNSLTNDK